MQDGHCLGAPSGPAVTCPSTVGTRGSVGRGYTQGSPTSRSGRTEQCVYKSTREGRPTPLKTAEQITPASSARTPFISGAHGVHRAVHRHPHPGYGRRDADNSPAPRLLRRREGDKMKSLSPDQNSAHANWKLQNESPKDVSARSLWGLQAHRAAGTRVLVVERLRLLPALGKSRRAPCSGWGDTSAQRCPARRPGGPAGHVSVAALTGPMAQPEPRTQGRDHPRPQGGVTGPPHSRAVNPVGRRLLGRGILRHSQTPRSPRVTWSPQDLRDPRTPQTRGVPGSP